MRFLVLVISFLSISFVVSAKSGTSFCCAQAKTEILGNYLNELPINEKTCIEKSVTVAPRVHSDVTSINLQVFKNFAGYIIMMPVIQNFSDYNAKHLSCPKHHFW